MKLSNHTAVPVYTISGSASARALPEWLARKRKRSLKNDPEYSSRIELLQDFEFEEASQCLRVSEDGNYVMSTGTYKPQIHTHYLPNLALQFARHTRSLNTTFELLSTDYTKSVHLQADRVLEFHTEAHCRYSVRIPRYGRDVKYTKRSAETLISAAGVNKSGDGEVFRLHLEYGRFMRPYEVDVGGDDAMSVGAGSLQGGVRAGSVNAIAVAEESHNLLAFGTSLGTVELWDPRARARVGTVQSFNQEALIDGRQATTAIEFHRSGLTVACGSSSGMVHIYDLRSPAPLIRKDQGYGCRIKKLIYLTPSATSRVQSDEPKILSADKRIIKIWDTRNGSPWTSVEPAVDLNDVVWCKDSGMVLTANEGRQQHAFFIPQLGPAPSWCSFLDNLVEEMAEDAEDPNAFMPGTGEIYENYKFLTHMQLDSLNLSHLIGTSNLLRPYMHGFFVAQKLYEEARIVADPFVFEDQRAKRLKEKLDKERESRIRGNKRIPGQVNKALAQKILAKEMEKTQLTEVTLEDEPQLEDHAQTNASQSDLLTDPRFAKLFTDETYAIDETSKVFKDLHPHIEPQVPNKSRERTLTAVEDEDLEDAHQTSSSEDESSGEEAPAVRRAHDKKRQKPKPANGHLPQPQVSILSSTKPRTGRDRTFGSRIDRQMDKPRQHRGPRVVGEQETSFIPAKRGKQAEEVMESAPIKAKDRRSASGNVFRKM